VLFVHSDRLSFEVTTEADEDADPDDAPPAGQMTDCVTAFVAVETLDETDVEATVAAAATELGALADQLNTDRIALYPSPLLSDDSADATTAATVLRRVEAALGEYDVVRAPAGWHASFEVSCKGHPLSTGVRTVDPTREAGRERTESEWDLLTPDGEYRDPVAASPDLDATVRRAVAEVAGERPSVDTADDESQSYAETLAEAGLATDASPSAGRSWLPRGKLVRDCLTAYVDDLARGYGALPVETPRAYDLDADAVRAHAAAFGGGDRADIDDRRALLRPAHCLGHCALLSSSSLDAADLPVRLYESGDVWNAPTAAGTRGSDIAPEMHTAVADASAAREEFRKQAALVREASATLGVAAAPVLRVTEAFRAANGGWIERLVADGDRPALVEEVAERTGCWSARLDLVAIDARGRPLETGTVRLDEETAARFGVEYADGSESRTPTMLHCSPAGPLDDSLRAILSDSASERSGIPTWLAPTQVRLIPVDGDHVATCDDAVDDLTAAGVRADVDERPLPVGDRLDRADDERVPYFAVVGEREGDGEPLPVTDRATGRERTMDVDELAATVREATNGFPSRERYGPRHLGDTPGFGR
jgi:threonyl-tRNA synthetase